MDCLTIQGYDHSYEAIISTFFYSVDIEGSEKYIAEEISKFVEIERQFDETDESVAVNSISRIANKDDMIKIIPT